MMDDATSTLADLHIAEQDSSRAASAADQHCNGRAPAGEEQDLRSAAASMTSPCDSGAPRRPPLYLVNARRPPSQGGAGSNIVNVYTRDGAPPSEPLGNCSVHKLAA